MFISSTPLNIENILFSVLKSLVRDQRVKTTHVELPCIQRIKTGLFATTTLYLIGMYLEIERVNSKTSHQKVPVDGFSVDKLLRQYRF